MRIRRRFDKAAIGMGKTKYPHSQTIYSNWYQSSARSIREWVLVGKRAGELPPLDNPKMMPAWWRQHREINIPDKIFEAESRKAAMEASALGDSELGTLNPSVSADSIPSSDLSAGNEPEKNFGTSENHRRENARGADNVGLRGISGMLRRLEDAEHELANDYLHAVRNEKASDAEVDRARRRWEGATESLRKLQKDAPSILKAQGELLVRSEVCDAIQQAHGALRAGLETFFKRIRPRMDGLNEREQNELWDTEVQMLLREMCLINFGLEAVK